MSERHIDRTVEISISKQRLWLKAGADVVAEYGVSTSAFGPGEQEGSLCTPRGAHVIDELIGDAAEPGAVFVGREATGEVWSEQLHAEHPDRDWILSRIIWLSGAEPGTNEGGNVDTKSRYIYIHGTTPIDPMGVPFSHGCVRMDMQQVIELFDQLEPGMTVQINP